MSRKRTKHHDDTIEDSVPVKTFRKLEAKTPGQQDYIDLVKNNSITFIEGPPGCGKSFMAVGMAVEALRRGHVEKIVLTRPLIEACGEELGALKGDVMEKVGPFLSHLLEALESFASKTEIEGWLAKGIVRIIPCAHLRGKSFHRSFILVDEANNLNYDQMKLILGRIGMESILIFAGDSKQSDLRYNMRGAFSEYMEILRGLPFIGIGKLTKHDIVRSPLIAEIFDRIEAWEERNSKTPKGYLDG